MAITVPSQRSNRRQTTSPDFGDRHNAVVMWHLCSLDAPTVAAVWTAAIAHVAGVAVPFSSIAAMALAVWILYVGDRLLDARLLGTHLLFAGAEPAELEARHYFHHRHRSLFLTAIVICSILLSPLLVRIQAAAIDLYLVEGSLLVAWFLLIHATRTSFRLPKELAVGIFFAAAVFIPTVAGAPQLRVPLLAPALLLAGLCSLNCLFIYSWEHDPKPYNRAVQQERAEHKDRAHFTTQFALRYLPQLAIILCGASVVMALWQHTVSEAAWSLDAACGISVVLLLWLHRRRRRAHPTMLRAAADLALLTPLLGLLHW